MGVGMKCDQMAYGWTRVSSELKLASPLSDIGKLRDIMLLPLLHLEAIKGARTMKFGNFLMTTDGRNRSLYLLLHMRAHGVKMCEISSFLFLTNI